MNLFQRLRHAILTANMDILAYAPMAVSIGILFLWVLTSRIAPNLVTPTTTTLVLILCSVITSLSGLIQIIRKESPGVVGKPLRGTVPVINGIITMVLFCGGGLFLLWNLIAELVK